MLRAWRSSISALSRASLASTSRSSPSTVLSCVRRAKPSRRSTGSPASHHVAVGDEDFLDHAAVRVLDHLLGGVHLDPSLSDDRAGDPDLRAPAADAADQQHHGERADQDGLAIVPVRFGVMAVIRSRSWAPGIAAPLGGEGGRLVRAGFDQRFRSPAGSAGRRRTGRGGRARGRRSPGRRARDHRPGKAARLVEHQDLGLPKSARAIAIRLPLPPGQLGAVRVEHGVRSRPGRPSIIRCAPARFAAATTSSFGGFGAKRAMLSRIVPG